MEIEKRVDILWDMANEILERLTALLRKMKSDIFDLNDRIDDLEAEIRSPSPYDGFDDLILSDDEEDE